MTKSLAPKLKKIKVGVDKLILDPNNPRLTTRKEDVFDEEDFLGMDLAGITVKKMRGTGDKDTYKIKELENSIRQNGWLPVDFIFVKKHSDGVHYIVLEGNRRITAIRNILTDEEPEQNLHISLKNIEVMEVIDEDDLDRKISYLLGVRHHGSLVRWTPFAQAHNILSRYSEISGQDPDSFIWDSNISKSVANALSVPIKEVEARLRVYRAMWQLGQMPEIINSQGGIKDRYYSVCAAVLLKKNSKLNDYIRQDPSTFLLDDESLGRFNNLCHFSEPKRDYAPIKNPQEWSKFENILKDEDDEKREKMLEEVEVSKNLPSIVIWSSKNGHPVKRLLPK